MYYPNRSGYLNNSNNSSNSGNFNSSSNQNRAMAKFLPYTGIITDISNMGGEGCTKMMAVRGNARDIVNFVVGPDTYVVNQTKLRVGMPVTAFYDANAPAILIYPPQFRAVVMAANTSQSIDVDWFDQNLLNQKQTLQLKISPQTNIVLENGQEFTGSLGNRNLIVLYTTATRSIPAQTTPDKIIVMCRQQQKYLSANEK